MGMRDYSTLHLDINSSKGTALLLLFCISQSQSSTMSKTHTLKCPHCIFNSFTEHLFNFLLGT